MSVKSKISGKDALHKSKVISKVERKRLNLAKDAQQEEKSWSVKWRMTKKTLNTEREVSKNESVNRLLLRKTLKIFPGREFEESVNKFLSENTLTKLREGHSQVSAKQVILQKTIIDALEKIPCDSWQAEKTCKKTA